jgi:iturin family lipopeptide synthetase B
MVGILLNTITFRNYPKPDLTFSEFLKQVKNNAFKVYRNSGYQFETLLDKINYKRKPNRNPLFDVLLNSQTISSYNGNGGAAEPDDGSLKFIPHQYKDTSTGFDLSIDVDDFKKFVHFRVYFRTSLFNRSTIEYLMTQFTSLLSQITESPEKEIRSFDVFQFHDPVTIAPKVKIKNKLKHYQHDIC